MKNKFDIIVVGTGNAALSAAVAASEEGKKVLMLEKGSKNSRGGNSFFTDGAIRFAYKNLDSYKHIVSDISEDDEIVLPKYDSEDFYNDMMKVTQGKSKPELARHLVENSYDTILWMKEQGVEFIANENQYFEKGGVKTFWGGLPTKTYRKGIGLVETLFKKAVENGVDIWYNTPAVKLETRNNRVTGVYVNKDSENVHVAADAVILACGGFEADANKRTENLGQEWSEAVVRGTKHNTGDGISMALEIGAVKAGQYDGCHGTYDRL